jgi:UDP-GlcNAc:undecaprenyl-phosphate/decaprenyl-phosphate GlcNAc-1-phosphate transferase
MIDWLVITLLLIAGIFGYFKFAEKFKIIDKPNGRSSHSTTTIRGGGIIFPFAALLWLLLFGFQHPFAIGGLILIAVISFLDDVYTISRRLRMFCHFLAVTLLFWEISMVDISWYYLLPAYLLFIGWINAFNFMDGINGITPLYSLIALGTFLFLAFESGLLPVEFIKILSISALIFAFVNARRNARAFAGDVGSVSMAFLLGWFMLDLILATQRIEYILFFVVYGMDSVFTILHRLMNRENIFKAHRSHLYQFLANEMNLPHVTVSLIYAGLQAAINILVIILLRNEIMNYPIFIGFLLVFSSIYLIARSEVLKVIAK